MCGVRIVKNMCKYSSENYYSDCIIIAKLFLDLAKGTMTHFYGRL